MDISYDLIFITLNILILISFEKKKQSCSTKFTNNVNISYITAVVYKTKYSFANMAIQANILNRPNEQQDFKLED